MAYEVGRTLRRPAPPEEISDWAGPSFDDVRLQNILAPQARLLALHTGTVHSEGPVWDRKSNRLLWSDVVNRRVLGWYPDGRVETMIDRTFFVNGNAFLPDGVTMVHCEHGRRCISRSGGQGDPEPWITHYQGKRLNSPNDIIVGADGAIWFSDPTFGISIPREGCLAEPELDHRSVYRFDPARHELQRMADFEQPNGLAFSPDGKLLYVSDTSRAAKGDKHEIQSFEVSAAGLSHRRVFCRVGKGIPDGFKVDKRGWIWSTADDGIHIFAPDGRELGMIPTPQTAGNCCFGGENMTRLFIAAETQLLAIDLAEPAL
ncbi:SMP-30/gluconolactonase/LRE family protein [Kozakia baliensis]|uniref:Gluconolactonase n=1 Tax=Kozakia baliensis TaxID=153496 RepID=A0A1D8UWG5_9PROT|nr:SMP-30/gluconolactonase/LRE family protein [Kozakia baliensis]AOX17982.1 gluconolactonase [Kozakia baliensis]GBR23987.1 gluconolactonase [Kozakia baliensis NRIC 0488]GEL64638.1 gluconolactonase [Kozakia baliensis]